MSESIMNQEDALVGPADDKISKDSRRSWFVCLGALLLLGFSIGVTNSFGVIFISLIDEFHESKAKIAWIGSFQFISYMIISPVCSSFTRSYGFTRVVLVGSTLFCLGLLSSSFAKQVGVLFVSYGLLVGIGTSFLFIPAVTVPPFVFQKHLTTALGFVITANGFFTLWIGPVYEYLIRKYGWRIALRLLTLLIIPLGLAGTLLPNKGEVVEEDENKLPKSKLSASLVRVLKNKIFLLWILIMFLVYLGMFIPMIHLISFSQDIGIPSKVSIYSMSCMFGFDTIGRFMFGILQDYFHWNVYLINTVALLVLAVSMTLLPLANAVSHLFFFAAFYGLAMGVQCLCVLIITSQVSHPDDSKHAIAYLFAALSIPGGAGPAVAAWIYDSSRSYHMAFFIAGGIFAVAACLGILLSSLMDRKFKSSKNNILNTKDIIQLNPMQSLLKSPDIGGTQKRGQDMRVSEYLTVV